MSEIWRERDKNGSAKDDDREYVLHLQRSMVKEEEEEAITIVPSV